jgi:fructoselysine-6-P-deglycase FrlB-like protein
MEGGSMENRRQIQEIPGALRMTLEKARAEYGAVVRKIRWGDGPVYVCGVGDCAALGWAAGYAFEMLLGWPVVTHSAEVFQSYGLALLRPRSVLVMIFPPGEWPEAQALAHSAHERGCTLVALANTLDSPLAKLAEHVFLARTEGEVDSPNVTVCLHAALNFLAFEAMRVLKRSMRWWEQADREFGQLPDRLEWVFTQLPSLARSVAAEMAGFPRLRIVGGGFYHYPAWRAARRLEFLTGLAVEALEASEFSTGLAHFARRDDAVLFLSGSHSKIKKLVHRCGAQARLNGARVLSLTDSNDRDLADGSDVGILIPELLEVTGCTLTLFMLEWLAMETLRAMKQPPVSSP